MKKRTQILITIFGGWFGLHKYLSGQIGMGIVYTLTFGLFYIGWIYDCVKAFRAPSEEQLQELLKWQELVYPNTIPGKLVITRKQLNSASKMLEENSTRILNDCRNLIHSTYTPDVFFKRYQLAIDSVQNLCKLSQFYPVHPDPNDMYKELIKDKTLLTNDFLDRTWNKVKEDADKLKTEKGKLNRYAKFKEEIEKYYEEMTAESINYFKQLK